MKEANVTVWIFVAAYLVGLANGYCECRYCCGTYCCSESQQYTYYSTSAVSVRTIAGIVGGISSLIVICCIFWCLKKSPPPVAHPTRTLPPRTILLYQKSAAIVPTNPANKDTNLPGSGKPPSYEECR